MLPVPLYSNIMNENELKVVKITLWFRWDHSLQALQVIEGLFIFKSYARVLNLFIFARNKESILPQATHKMRSLYKICIVLFTIVSGWSVYAQPASVPTPSGGGLPPPPPDLPIDDYIVTIVLFSILYGFYVISYKLKEKTPR